MKLKALLASLLLAAASTVTAQTPIECTPEPKSISSMWPGIYLSKTKELCFDVRGWASFRGQNCVRNGGAIQWQGVVIVSMDGESQGRDDTTFRVRKPVVTDERLEYVIEWTRSNDWRPMQHVSINRLTGVGVSYFVTMHGGDTMNCHIAAKKL
jgi:hypothetical protein